VLLAPGVREGGRETGDRQADAFHDGGDDW
jgi:hypothetical protein